MRVIRRSHELDFSHQSNTRPHPALSARVRCRQTIWDATVLLGTLMSGTAVLLDLVIEEALQLHLISALIFATVPLVAALTAGAILVVLLWLLGIGYDVLRLFVLPGFLWCVCSGAPLLVQTARRLSLYFDATFGRTGGGLIEFAGGIAIDIPKTLSRVGTRARSALGGMSRHIALEALWIKQRVRGVLGATAWIACWPIRTSALLLLWLVDQDPAPRADRSEAGLRPESSRR